MVQPRPPGVNAVVVVCDEIAALRSLKFDMQTRSYIGLGSRGRYMLSQEEYEKAKFTIMDCASKVKFTCVVPQSGLQLRVFTMRPGNADSSEESEWNDRQMGVLSSAGRAVGVHVLGMLFDGISKEFEFWSGSLVKWLRALPEEQAVQWLPGLDIKHQTKCARGSMAFGATVCPYGGWLVTDMSLFQHLGVSIDNVRVKDKFADFRVEELFKVLPDFGTLAHSGRPITEVLGTCLYTSALFWAQTAATSKTAHFSRRDRLHLVIAALQVVTSFHNAAPTQKNFVGCFLSLALAICDARVTRPNRWSTAQIEYFFGNMRTRGPGDQLTVCQMKYIAARMGAFMAWCHEHGFKSGAQCRSYAVAHEAVDSLHPVLQDDAVPISEFVAIPHASRIPTSPSWGSLGRLECLGGASWGCLGPSWGASWGSLGGLLGPSWGPLGGLLALHP